MFGASSGASHFLSITCLYTTAAQPGFSQVGLFKCGPCNIVFYGKLCWRCQRTCQTRTQFLDGGPWVFSLGFKWVGLIDRTALEYWLLVFFEMCVSLNKYKATKQQSNRLLGYILPLLNIHSWKLYHETKKAVLHFNDMVRVPLFLSMVCMPWASLE